MSTREEKERVALRQGTLDLLIFRTLRLGPEHGHVIGKAIEFRSHEVLQVEQGSLYRSAAPADQAGLDFGGGGHLQKQPQR